MKQECGNVADEQVCESVSVEQHMIAFHELPKPGLLAENSRNVELGEVFHHMRQRYDHLLGVSG